MLPILKNKYAFILAFLFLTSVSAEEFLHEHHDHDDHIVAELNCDFCVEVAPEFNNKVNADVSLLPKNYLLIEIAENQYSKNDNLHFFSRGPPKY